MTPRHALVLAVSRTVGWSIAAAMFALVAVVVVAQVRSEKFRAASSSHDFQVKVRACVHGKQLAVPTWEACERAVQQAE